MSTAFPRNSRRASTTGTDRRTLHHQASSCSLASGVAGEDRFPSSLTQLRQTKGARSSEKLRCDKEQLPYSDCTALGSPNPHVKVAFPLAPLYHLNHRKSPNNSIGEKPCTTPSTPPSATASASSTPSSSPACAASLSPASSPPSPTPAGSASWAPPPSAPTSSARRSRRPVTSPTSPSPSTSSLRSPTAFARRWRCSSRRTSASSSPASLSPPSSSPRCTSAT